MEYQYLEDEIALSKAAKKLLKKAKEQESEKLKKGYIYVKVKKGLEILTPTNKDGEPIYTKEQLIQKYNI